MDTIVSQRGKDNWIYEGYRNQAKIYFRI